MININELEKELNEFMSMTPSKAQFFELINRTRSAESAMQEIELHRADHSAMKAIGFESVAELLAAYKVMESKIFEIENQKPFAYVDEENIDDEDFRAISLTEDIRCNVPVYKLQYAKYK